MYYQNRGCMNAPESQDFDFPLSRGSLKAFSVLLYFRLMLSKQIPLEIFWAIMLVLVKEKKKGAFLSASSSGAGPDLYQDD